MSLLSVKARLVFLAALTLVGVATTAYWVQQNGSCTVQTRTTIPETGETVVTNKTVSGGFAPAICSMESTQSILLGAAGPMLTVGGLWFGIRTIV